jgi:pimeloyl-ACP methyl ester carboxylesterase
VIRAGDARIGFTDVGAGPAVVFVHGFAFDRRMWRSQWEYLSERGFRVVAVDLRGFGGSTVTVPEVSMRSLADDIEALRAALHLDDAVFCGYSMGGQVVMEYLRSHPERVRALVFSDTFSGLDAPDVAEGRLRLADRLESEGMAGYAGENLEKLIAPYTVAEQPAVAELVLTMMLSTDPAGAAAALRGRAHRPDYDAVVSEAAAPALVLVGEDDAFDRGVLAAGLSERMPDGRLRVVPHSGHTPSLESPAFFNAALAEFMETIRP